MTLHTEAPEAPHTRILGVGHYQPATVVTNDDLVARGVDTNDEWIRSRVGIAERRFAAPDESVVDMAEAASSKALANAGVDPSAVDLVLAATARCHRRCRRARPSWRSGWASTHRAPST